MDETNITAIKTIDIANRLSIGLYHSLNNYLATFCSVYSTKIVMNIYVNLVIV